MPHSYRLIYFDARGRAEVSRLLFALAGQKYEDVRHTHDSWPAEKPNTPFGQAPCLDVDGKIYAQSTAIATFLAREFGFYGKTNLDGLKIDQIVQRGMDFLNDAVKAFYEKDEAKKAELFKTVKEVAAVKYLGDIEKQLEESGTGFFVGNSMTLADIFTFDLLDNFIQRKVVCIEKYPAVSALYNKVKHNEKIESYLATRKQTEN